MPRWREAKRQARTRLKRLRKAIGRKPLDEALVAQCDDKHIVVLREKFFHDRSSLEQLIAKVPERGVMIEVGSLAGFSTKLFSRHFDRVYSVDPYAPGYDDRYDQNSERFRLHLARDLFTIRFLDEPGVVQYRESSSEACARFEDRSVDFVYVDAGHTFEDVDRDIRCWSPKVKQGGYIAGDDFGWDGVKRAVAHHFDDYEVIAGRWLARVG